MERIVRARHPSGRYDVTSRRDVTWAFDGRSPGVGPEELVVGIDAVLSCMSAVDQVAHALAELTRIPGRPRSSWITTHEVWMSGPSRAPRLAITMSAPGAGEDELWNLGVHGARWLVRLGVTYAESPDEVGLAMGSRREGLPGLARAAAAAARERTARAGGRVVYFPGMEALTGPLTVAEIVHVSTIEAVLEGGDPLRDDAVVLAGSHLRPRWDRGRLVMDVMSGAAGDYHPSEAVTPTPCGRDHTLVTGGAQGSSAVPVVDATRARGSP